MLKPYNPPPPPPPPLPSPQHSIIAASHFSRWQETHCTDRNLLTQSLHHYEKVVGSKQVSKTLIEEVRLRLEGPPAQRNRSVSIGGDQGNDRRMLFDEACFNIATVHYMLGQVTPGKGTRVKDGRNVAKTVHCIAL